jgi:hypothetical protein
MQPMQMREIEDPWLGQTVVLGPCPGCDAWQIDYTQRVVQEYVVMLEDGTDPDTGLLRLKVDLSAFHNELEALLQEHVDECPHLRDLVENYA